MLVSQKCQYALRAIFELAKCNGRGPKRIADIAKDQAIPVRFLEIILNQLKQGGFVESRRGSEGGYFFTRSPEELTVGEIIRFVQGPIGPIECVADASKEKCPLYSGCVFLPMWKKVQQAISDVYDNITFGDLVNKEREKSENYIPYYSI